MSAHALTITAAGRPVVAPAVEDTAEDRLCRLMSEYERPLYLYLLVRVRDADVALDCAQETFLRAFQALRRGQRVNRQWLYTVARNHSVDLWRRSRKTETGMEALEDVGVEENTDQSMIVRQVMAQMPPLDRDVLYLFAVCGFKTDEIGSIVGASGSAVRQRLYRARERFRVLYGETA